ncbi:MAG: multidrug efflux RND transporter permease subunit [Campylobacteraceae bacterium]|jgi:multidrug efflux pump|nr:multidrug efflux RND transporter permease subunit [Campylobacteraceae bacterium]
MFSKFFIYRPIFATVISIIVLIAGFAAIKELAVEEYPNVTPPQVSVFATYVGASAETIANTVAAPLEQQINGVDNMLYMTSTSSSSGALSINVLFKIGTDPDQATIDVNNRVQQVLAILPSEVQARGVTVIKRSSTILKLVALYSENSTYNVGYMANYALINVIDELKRVKGVGDAALFSRQNYSIRVWTKPDMLAKYNFSPNDVLNAIREQNSQFAPGKFNQSPNSGNEAFTYSITTDGRFTNVKEFEDIIMRTNPDGSTLRLKDIARIELGIEAYDVEGKIDAQEAVAIGIFLQSGANALETAELVDETLERISKNFPEHLKYIVPYDTTDFIQISVDEVVKTFIEAIILVMLIVYMFLGNVRATIIPMLAVPVSIIGTFAGMYAMGFSINLLTLFGLILAIGIVVDDAIIVIENIERIIHSDPKISVKNAAVKAMQEVTGPVVAIVLILCAVFIPVSFLGGFVGQMYQQFAITIVISVVISGIVALTLTPALCAVFLTKKEPRPFWFVRKFNEFFDFSTNIFTSGVKLILRYGVIAILIFAVLMGATYELFKKVPTELVPPEDKGVVLAAVMLPPASSLDRTKEVANKFTQIVKNDENVKQTTFIAGVDLLNSFSARTSSGISFVVLKDWDERKNQNQSSFAIASRFMRELNFMIPEATVVALNPPAIMGLSISSGFEMYVQDRTGGSMQTLQELTNQIVEKAKTRKELSGASVRTNFDINYPQYKIEIDKEKAKSYGVSISDAFAALQSSFGSYYVNDFDLYGRSYRVNVQADNTYREKPEDAGNIFVRSQNGNLIPLSSLVKFEKMVGADIIERYNVFNAAKITGDANVAEGYTSGDALKAIEEVANEVLPEGYNIGWIGSSYQEKEMEGSGAKAFLFGVIFIFLILSAQYERWLMPLAVVTAVPFAALGAILAVYLRGISNDIYFQIGLLVLVGLAAKNAVLIVEFAMLAQEKGKNVLDATLEAAKLRFRPIVMTSLAFTLGVIPLAISSGAGAASRHAIGTGVIGGMIASTTIAIFYVPLFYSWLAKLNQKFISKRTNDNKKGNENE